MFVAVYRESDGMFGQTTGTVANFIFVTRPLFLGRLHPHPALNKWRNRPSALPTFDRWCFVLLSRVIFIFSYFLFPSSVCFLFVYDLTTIMWSFLLFCCCFGGSLFLCFFLCLFCLFGVVVVAVVVFILHTLAQLGEFALCYRAVLSSVLLELG